MVSQTRHTLETPHRKRKGEPWVTNILAWLNQESRPAPYDRIQGKNTVRSRARIHDLIATIIETKEVITAAANAIYGPNRTGDRLLCKPPRKVTALLLELDTRLSDYPSEPSADIDSDGRTVFIDDGVLTGKRPIGECLAAYGVIRLVNLGLLDRVSKCECGRYYFGRFSHQTFCSPKCRKKHHESSEQYKVARREYMRRYYQLKTSGKVK